MHKEIILVVNQRGLVIICPKNHNQQPLVDNQYDIVGSNFACDESYSCILAQLLIMVKWQQMIVMDKFSANICGCCFKLDAYT